MRVLEVESVGLLTPGPFLFVLLLLGSSKGLPKALAYTSGYGGGYVLMGSAVLLVSQRLLPSASGQAEGPSSITPWISIGLGVLLLLMGLRMQLRRPSPGHEQSGPAKFFASLDTLSVTRIFGLGALTSVMLFQNLGIYLMGVAVVVDSDLSLGHGLLVNLAGAAYFCVPCIVPLVIFMFAPARAARRLRSFKQTLERKSRALGTVAMFVMGSLLLYRGVSALA